MRKWETFGLRQREHKQAVKLEEINTLGWAFIGGIFSLLKNMGKVRQKKGLIMAFS